MKIIKTIKLKIVIFTAVKNRCILHGRVFVMPTDLTVHCANCCILYSFIDIHYATSNLKDVVIHSNIIFAFLPKRKEKH